MKMPDDLTWREIKDSIREFYEEWKAPNSDVHHLPFESAIQLLFRCKYGWHSFDGNVIKQISDDLHVFSTIVHYCPIYK